MSGKRSFSGHAEQEIGSPPLAASFGAACSTKGELLRTSGRNALASAAGPS